jgi:Tfp pilus assembly protein PilX
MKKGGMRRHSGFVLLSLMVFLFVAALLALGDMRTLAVQQTLVATTYAAQNAMVETESALATMEQFAAFEGSELGKTGGNARLTQLTNDLSTTVCTNGSEPPAMACVKSTCNSFLYPKGSVTGDDNVAGTRGTTLQLRTGTGANECSFCPPPTPACKARWEEAPGASDSPWAEFPVNFYDIATTGAAPSNPTSSVYSTKKFYGMVEYLGWAQCDMTEAKDPTGTNLDAYGSTFEPTSQDQTRGCRVMRVTVRNQPPKQSLPTITLQSTLLVASVLNYPAGVYNSVTPRCCLLPDASQPASSIDKSVAHMGQATFAGAIDAERISWRQIFSSPTEDCHLHAPPVSPPAAACAPSTRLHPDRNHGGRSPCRNFGVDCLDLLPIEYAQKPPVCGPILPDGASAIHGALLHHRE